jgi:hypothetical protein
MNGGYIVSAFFHEQSMYSKFEMISYSNVKDIYLAEEGITFQADGHKIFWLVEPSSYTGKTIEPTYRSDLEKIPYRMNEVEVFTTKRQDRVLVGKKPVYSFTSFTIMKSQGQNYSYVFFMGEDLLATMQNYFAKSLYDEAGVPRSDAAEVSKYLIELFKKIIVKQSE